MRLAPPLLAAVLALTITGCVDEGAGPGPTAAQSDSVESGQSTDSPSEEESSPSSTPTDTGTPFDPEEFTSRLEAAVDANPTLHVEITVSSDGQQALRATGEQDMANNSLDMQVELGGQQLGYRLVDGQYYLAQPPKWLAVAEDSSNPAIQQTVEQIQALSMRNQFNAFVAGVEKAGDKGNEEIDGVATRHHTATVDTAKAYAELGLERGPSTPDQLIYDVWLDEDDLIRRMTFALGEATATLTATDWGEPITIEKPRKSEIAQSPDTGTP